MAIPDAHKEFFQQIIAAGAAGALGVIECTVDATGETATALAILEDDGETTNIFPFALLDPTIADRVTPPPFVQPIEEDDDDDDSQPNARIAIDHIEEWTTWANGLCEDEDAIPFVPSRAWTVADCEGRLAYEGGGVIHAHVVEGRYAGDTADTYVVHEETNGDNWHSTLEQAFNAAKEYVSSMVARGQANDDSD